MYFHNERPVKIARLEIRKWKKARLRRARRTYLKTVPLGTQVFEGSEQGTAMQE